MNEVNPTGPNSVLRPDFVPAADYISAESARREKERLWPKIWQIACREEEIPNVGDYTEYRIFEESILIVRTAEHEIKAFYNACQHRGRRLLDEPKGRIAQFYCRYHGWRYHLDGSIAYIHNREDWEACPTFKESGLSLKQPRVDRWAGWVWINLDPNAQSLKTYLGIVPQFLDPFEFENMRIVWSATIDAPVNWKVIIEAFIEGYHAFATHSVGGVNYKPAKFPGYAHGLHSMFIASFSALPEMKNAQGAWMTPVDIRQMTAEMSIGLHDEFKAMILEPGATAAKRLLTEVPEGAPHEEVASAFWRFHREAFAEAGIDWPPRLTREAVDAAGTGWHIFPNNSCLPTIDGAVWYCSRPVDDNPGRCIFDTYCLGRVPKGEHIKPVRQTFDGFSAFVGSNSVLEEDFVNMVAVQKGMSSRGWDGARTSPLQEIQISHFHRNLHDYLYESS